MNVILSFPDHDFRSISSEVQWEFQMTVVPFVRRSTYPRRSLAEIYRALHPEIASEVKAVLARHLAAHLAQRTSGANVVDFRRDPLGAQSAR